MNNIFLAAISLLAILMLLGFDGAYIFGPPYKENTQ